jgi:hypothetical protein
MPFDQYPNRMLSTEEAANLMGLQPCTLSAWREDGSQPDLAFFKIGKAVRYRYGDVIAFLNARRAVSTLAARQLRRLSQSAQPDQGRARQPDAAARLPKMKKPAQNDAGSDGQQTLF